MKAVYIETSGGPESLVYGDRPDLQAGPGETAVRVHATAVNHAGLRVRSGRTSIKQTGTTSGA
jgi:NADPH:quinone reductase-like Zn-dependent oxidoreductase